MMIIDVKQNWVRKLISIDYKFMPKEKLHLNKFFNLEISRDKFTRNIEPERNELFSNENFFSKKPNASFDFASPSRFQHQSLSPEQQDIQAINEFLSNAENVAPFLKQIEQELSEFVKTMPENDPYYPHRTPKLLSSYLRQEIQKNGFKGYARLMKGLDKKEFYSVLQAGTLFKDKALRGEFHGDYTHLIQWLLIIKWNNYSHKLNKTPVELYQWIGHQENAEKIWLETFEVGTTKDFKSDFGAVFILNNYLLSHDCYREYPLLHKLIKKRADKGAFTCPEDQEAVVTEYFKLSASS